MGQLEKRKREGGKEKKRGGKERKRKRKVLLTIATTSVGTLRAGLKSGQTKYVALTWTLMIHKSE
jgi:hypothetical protein